MALARATSPGHSRPGGDEYEEVLCISQSSSITGTSPSDYLVTYPGHSLGRGLTPLLRCSRCIIQSQLTSPPLNSENKYFLVATGFSENDPLLEQPKEEQIHYL